MLLYVELNSEIRLRPDLSSQIRPDPALAGFGKVKSGTSLLIILSCWLSVCSVLSSSCFKLC